MRDDVKREIFELHAGLCKALADPKRLLIVEALRGGARTVGDLSGELGLSQSNVSQHLAILRQRGVVRARRLGNNVFYSLTTPKILRALDILRDVMNEQLDQREQLRVSAAEATA